MMAAFSNCLGAKSDREKNPHKRWTFHMALYQLVHDNEVTPTYFHMWNEVTMTDFYLSSPSQPGMLVLPAVSAGCAHTG